MPRDNFTWKSCPEKKSILIYLNLIKIAYCKSNILLFLEGRIPRAQVAKPCYSTTGQRMTDSKKDPIMHLTSSLVRRTMNKMMKTAKKMGQQQILAFASAHEELKGKCCIPSTVFLYQQGMILQFGRVFPPPSLFFCFPSRRTMNDYNTVIHMILQVHALFLQCLELVNPRTNSLASKTEDT